MKDFAKVDNGLAASQLAIGESSNLAQIALTYTYNFEDRKYSDYVCILATIAQVAVDSSKRAYDIDIGEEIRRIKKDMDLENNGLPFFWLVTKRDKRKVRNEDQRKARDKNNKDRIRKKIEPSLDCPMNYLYRLRFGRTQYEKATIDMSHFWIKHDIHNGRRNSKAVEELIQNYSIKLYEYNSSEYKDDSDYLLLKDDFDNLISDIKKIYISRNYLGMMSWLINRAFCIGDGVKKNKSQMDSKLSKNRSILLKTLYVVSPEVFLQCFVEKRCTLEHNEIAESRIMTGIN